MKKAPLPENEVKRLEALNSYHILDTFPEEEYDNITKIASEICDTPMALVSLVDTERQWFKSHHGLGATETHRDYAFCAHTILEPDNLFIVSDATKDERFFDNPLITGDPHVAFYAGAPLNTSDGFSLGTLCVVDTKPREPLTEGQKSSLKALANQVMVLLELRRKNMKLEHANNEISRLNDQLSHFAYRLTHDLKTPIRGINALVAFIKQDHADLFKDTKVEDMIELIYSRSKYMDTLIGDILEYTKVNNADIHFEKFSVRYLIENVLINCDVEKVIKVYMENVDVEIIHSSISFVQIFQNLLLNSRQFNDKETCEVQIKLIEEKDYYRFIYEDNGPGIPRKYWEKVFVMFETLDEGSNNNTGIGLATVKSIITRLGGSITIKNRDDHKTGVCFDFTVEKNNMVV
ncbi:sensor histidine kinase [Mariniflexile sp. AS56]|uniref:sensor histidine kinase n=1 Tax=Mariniflexile sp. AS56 TaxID=3063957 RepID=UPI0026F3283F|nr:GAF domain-containing sensor histidine kinase [Mariniflexile sp. AS56]MDO7173541.1 GAF domain-containing sensor histidine kinase [Mariniflexile sp. AS56]